LDRNYINTAEGEKVKISVKSDTARRVMIEIKIYNLNGEIIRALKKEVDLQAGWNIAEEWDAANDAGRRVGRGMYFIVIKIDNEIIMKRIMVIK